MKINSRIASILNASQLDESFTGFPSFSLSELDVPAIIDYELPISLRLGHLVERIVAKLFSESNNFELLYENLQIIDGKQTIGEIDFIIEDKNTNQHIHVELAYKFYLLDPSISSEEKRNWIGPNRRDSLVEKLNKLKSKQFPLLKNEFTKSFLQEIDVNMVEQKLCLLVSLYVPFQYHVSSILNQSIKGYYLDIDTFFSLNHTSKKYFIPSKKEWGVSPANNENWLTFDEVKGVIKNSIDEKQSLLCWQKEGDVYSELFIVWWGRK